MHVTELGLLLIPLGIFLFIAAPRWIYILAVFFIPFTATSLVNSRTGVPLTPGLFFGSLFILHEMMKLAIKGRMFPFWRKDKAIIPLLIFLAAALLSAFMPLAIDGGARSFITNDLTNGVLEYSVQTFKGTFQVLFGISFLFFVITKNLTIKDLIKTIRIYLFAAIFVCLWGTLEFLCKNIFHIEYPAFIFNTAILDTMQGYKQSVYIAGMPFFRIASVTHEPSIFAKFLITVVPILLVAVVLKMPLLARKGQRLALALVVGVMLLSTSATAYIGLIAVLIIIGWLMIVARIWRPRHLLLKAIILPGATLGLAFMALPIVQTMVNWLVFEKISSGSVVQRSDSIAQAWTIFEQFPLLGAGWAMVTSNDLIVYLLANVGLTGFFSFFVAVGLVLFGTLREMRRLRGMPGSQPRLLLGLVLVSTGSLASLLAVSVVTGIELYLEYFYFVLALAISANIIIRRELDCDHRLHTAIAVTPSIRNS